MEKTGVKCPLCHDGDVVVKKTKKAVIFSAVQIIRIVNLLAGENRGVVNKNQEIRNNDG